MYLSPCSSSCVQVSVVGCLVILFYIFLALAFAKVRSGELRGGVREVKKMDWFLSASGMYLDRLCFLFYFVFSLCPCESERRRIERRGRRSEKKKGLVPVGQRNLDCLCFISFYFYLWPFRKREMENWEVVEMKKKGLVSGT